MFVLVQGQMKDQQDRMVEAENSIILLKSLGASSGSGGASDNSGLLDALAIMVENLRKECYAKFAEKDDLSKFRKRIENLEH